MNISQSIQRSVYENEYVRNAAICVHVRNATICVLVRITQLVEHPTETNQLIL